jgi:SAM-dependent methyltransferase
MNPKPNYWQRIQCPALKTISISLHARHFLFIAFLSCLVGWNPGYGQQENPGEDYTFRKGDPNGIGKWYMGREIAFVMGYQGMGWLERPDREAEENTSLLIENLEIRPEDRIADIGAGSGYHVFRMAPLASEGVVYAVDIQPEMLRAIERRKKENNTNNVVLVKGAEKSVNLPENSVDKVLMVDVYHEFSYPAEILVSIIKALRPGGKIYLIEYKGEDESIPIKKLHKMTEYQSVKEMNAAGLKLQGNLGNLPKQHCMVFVKES